MPGSTIIRCSCCYCYFLFILWCLPLRAAQMELSTYKLHAFKTWDMADILDGQPFQVTSMPAAVTPSAGRPLTFDPCAILISRSHSTLTTQCAADADANLWKQLRLASSERQQCHLTVMVTACRHVQSDRRIDHQCLQRD